MIHACVRKFDVTVTVAIFLRSERGLKFCGISVHILDMRYGRHGDLVALVQGKFPNAAVPWVIAGGQHQHGNTIVPTEKRQRHR